MGPNKGPIVGNTRRATAPAVHGGLERPRPVGVESEPQGDGLTAIEFPVGVLYEADSVADDAIKKAGGGGVDGGAGGDLFHDNILLF